MSYSLGVDAGSRYTKFALMKDGEIKELFSFPSDWNTKELAAKTVDELIERYKTDSLKITATGYGRVSVDADRTITEITCHAKGAHFLYPKTGTVIDIGGQDSKIIVLDENGAVTDFVMNDKCAAGTGKFIEMMLAALGESFETLDEAVKDKNPVKITSTCAVFAESEIVGLLANGFDRAEILAGVVESAAVKVAGLSGRVKISGEIFFSGGLCASESLRSSLEVRLGRKIVSDERAQFAGAIGAAFMCEE